MLSESVQVIITQALLSAAMGEGVWLALRS
jgi:hypothetical protein